MSVRDDVAPIAVTTPYRAWRWRVANGEESEQWTVWLCAGAAALAGAAFWLAHQALIDDAYITLSYARNLATHLHWGLIPTEPANSATSPLNVLLLAAATVLLRLTGAVYPIWGLGLVFVGSTVALAWWWSRVAIALRLSPMVPALGVTLVLLNPFVLSATGLEVLLIPTVLVGMLAAAVRGRPVAFGVLAGLAALTRLGLAVFVIPLALASAGVRRAWPRAGGVAIAVCLPWFAWSWWTFGSAIPDTFAIKTEQRGGATDEEDVQGGGGRIGRFGGDRSLAEVGRQVSGVGEGDVGVVDQGPAHQPVELGGEQH